MKLSLSQRHALLAALAESPNAYATLQPFLDHFDTPHGFIAYGRALGGVITIDDPVARQEDYPALFSAFLDRSPHATLVNLSEQSARALATLPRPPRPLYFAPIGTEHVLSLDDRSLSAPLHPQILGAIKKAKRHHLHLREVTLSELPDHTLRQLHHVNRDFLARSQPGHEIPFIARQCLFVDEPGVRVFLIHHDYRCNPLIPQGFLTLDPWYSGGSLIGYQLNQTRFYRTRLWGVYLSLTQQLRELLHHEGHAALSLGACSLYQNHLPHPFPTTPAYRALLSVADRHADSFHKMSNFTQMKLLFPGSELRRFIASTDPTAILGLVRLLRVSSTLSAPVIRTQLERAWKQRRR